MEFTVYCHEISPGSDANLFFTATLEQVQTEVAEYRAELFQIDPDREPIATLGIYEIVLKTPDAAMMIELLNCPEEIYKTCLVSKKLVGLSVD
ncbi:hypothetical protein ACU8MP_16470 [Rhizobium leguminosarum]